MTPYLYIIRNYFSKSKIIFFFFLLFAGAVNAQVKWQDMVNNKNATFYQVQQDFRQYWQGKTPQKGQGYKVFKRWEENMAPRVYPSGNMTLPSSTYSNFITWKNNAGNQRVNAVSSTANWTAIGPLTKASGYDAGVGRIDFVRFHPTDANTMFVGSPDGGLWKTTDGGASWTTNTDFLPIIGVSDIVIDPTNTQIMYLATGNRENDRTSIGILKSTDGGSTWNTTGLTFPSSNGWTIRKLAMDPTDPQVMIAVLNVGIFRTTDGWANWNGISPTPLGGNLEMDDVEFKPGDHNTVYAVGKDFYKSTDNGVSFTQITSGFPSSSLIVRSILAVTPANPDYVYVICGNNTHGYNGTYRSTNSGASFTTQSTAPNILGYEKINPIGTSGQAGHDLAIAVSPTDANLVTIGGINQWQSADGGVNWNCVSYWLGSDANYPGQGEGPPDYTHADIQDIMYLPGSSTTMFATSDGGISKSTNGGANWTDISNNLSVAQMNSVAQSALTPYNMVPGLQDIGTLRNTNGNWFVTNGGDGEDGFIDRTDDMVQITSNPFGKYKLSTTGGVGGSDITGLPVGLEFFSPILQDPVSANTVYAGGRPALYRSTTVLTNPTDPWTALGTPGGTGPGPNFNPVGIRRFDIAASNNQVIYVLKGIVVSKSIDGGTTWTDITGTLPVSSSYPTNICVSNTNADKVWVTFSGYNATEKAYRSIDGGTTWTNISAGLPNLPMNTIVYTNNSAGDAVYIGGDIGVYYMDNTTAWTPFFTGLANSHVTDLEIYYPTGKIRATTYGRGLWESDLYITAVNYTITASAGANGSISPSGAVSVASGASQTFTITPSACHQIATVLVDGVNNPGAVSSGTFTFTNVTAPHTISATFTPLTYTITASAGANGSISPNGATLVNCGASQTFTFTAASCYQIATVLVDGVNNPGAVSSGTFTFTNVTAPHTISATFSQLSYTITSSAGANGTITPNGATSVNCGDNQTYSITPAGGFNVQDVIVDGVSQGAVTTYTFSNVTAAHTISATFVAGAFTITASAGTGGTITPSGAVGVTAGANQTFNIAANSCYARLNVVVDGVSQGPIATYTFTNVTANHTINAIFVHLSTTITATAGANGTITPSGSTSLFCGANQTYAIAANSCFQIADVIVDGVSQGAISSYTFTGVTAAPHTISATFSQLSYTITSSAGANGTITPNGATSVNCGNNQTYSITPAGGFNVQDVLVDGVSVGAVTTYTFTGVNQNHTISASFLNVACVPPTVGSPTVTQPTCATPTGTIVVNATGGSTLEYQLNAGTFQLSNTFSGLTPGSYNITVRLQSSPTCLSTYSSNPVVLNAATGCSNCVITCPANKTVKNESDKCGKYVNYPAATVSGNCGGSLTYSMPSGSWFPVGTTVVTVTSPSGTSCSFTITVKDVQKPEITNCPADITVNVAANSCSKVVTFPVTATDNCPGVTVVAVPASGTAFNVGTTNVVITATDASGNIKKHYFKVTVIDNRPPVMTCPPNVVLPTDPGVCRSDANPVIPSATDNCPGVTVTGTRSDGKGLNAPYPLGETIITWKAKDASGNTKICNQKITVKDMQPPVISNVSVNPSVLWPANNDMVLVHVNYTVTDNCALQTCAPAACRLSVTSNEPVTGAGYGNLSPDWQIIDDNHVKLRAERSANGTGRIYTIKITCKDEAGNAVSQTVTVTVPLVNVNTKTASEVITYLKVQLLPNPTENEFNLVIKGGSGEALEIKVLDITGRELQRIRNASAGVIRFGNNLAQGTYMIEVRQGKERIVLKGVKQ